MRYHFLEFLLDTDRFELYRNETRLAAEPQVIELLTLLLEQRQRMVSKDEIYGCIWKGRIVSEAALSSRIKSLRQLLGDNGRSQAVIKTVHRKGFRFVAEVRCDESDAAPPEINLPSAEADIGSRNQKPTIAILPLANLSRQPEQDYLADGISGDIIAHLSRHRWINVVARNTTFGLRQQNLSLADLAAQLGTDYVVEGSVQRAANRVRVTVHLMDAHSGHQLWADRYDRELEDIFELQDEITETLVARLEPEIGYAERHRVMQNRPANLQAWDCYHLGIHHFFKFTGADNLEAQRLLLRSQELDPQFGDAFAWWAYALVLGMVYWDVKPTQATLDAALSACEQALMLDPQNATFYALKARVMLARREYDGAITGNRMAIELNPTFAAAHCGLGDSLAYEGHYDEAVECFTRAIALSPNDPQLWAFLTYGALALLFKGDYELALQWTERASHIPNCQYWTLSHKVVALVQLGRSGEARRLLAHIQRQLPDFSLTFVEEKLFYLKRPEQINGYLQALRKAGLD